jgi:hypothetical protein
MRKNIRWAAFFSASGLFLALHGCGQKPVGPSFSANLRVSLKASGDLFPSSLGNVAENEILYRVIGPGGSRRASGTVGPFTTVANDGTYDFSIQVPVGPDQVLALQLNDASDHTPLAVGAAQFSATGEGQLPVVTVDLGTVAPNGQNDISNATVIQGCAYIGYGYSMTFYSPVTSVGYDFTVDHVGGNDFEINCLVNMFTSTDRNVAYLGQGELVDFAYVPDDSRFFANSGDAKADAGNSTRPIQVGDVYCFKTHSVVGGFAWIKFYGSGVHTVDDPKFIYRINGNGFLFPRYDNNSNPGAYGYGHQNNC